MNCSRALIFLGVLLCSRSFSLYATHATNSLAIEEHSKVVTVDATPNDPGQVEVWNSYMIQGGKFAWKSNGARERRGTFFSQSWNTMTTVGIYRDIDIAVLEGFQHILDKENNFNEFRGLINSDTGETFEDSTEGPTHGFGWQDLGVTGRWRFYHSKEKKLEIAYLPTVFVPTGRRSNFDHLGPSLGYTSLDNSFAMTKDIGRWNGTVNAGYNVPIAARVRTNGLFGTAHANFAVGYQLLWWLQPEAEVIYSHAFGEHGQTGNLASVVLGAILPLGNHLRFELGVQQDVLGSNKVQTTSGIFSVALLT